MRQRIRLVADGHFAFLHDLGIAAWVLGGVRLISSARIRLANTGPGRNNCRRRPVSGSSSRTSVPRDVTGHQVGSELDASELEVENPSERPDQQRLGQSGHPSISRVPAKMVSRTLSITSCCPTTALPSSARSACRRWARR